MQADILVDATGNARIVDFGSAAFTRDSNSIESTATDWYYTSRYSAPEVLKEPVQHSKRSDVFAFGMVMIEVGGDKHTSYETASSSCPGFHRGEAVQ